ncbi:hypothetical protein AKJ16_DCAP26079, partial [Drosera capensis]
LGAAASKGGRAVQQWRSSCARVIEREREKGGEEEPARSQREKEELRVLVWASKPNINQGLNLFRPKIPFGPIGAHFPNFIPFKFSLNDSLNGCVIPCDFIGVVKSQQPVYLKGSPSPVCLSSAVGYMIDLFWGF